MLNTDQETSERELIFERAQPKPIMNARHECSESGLRRFSRIGLRLYAFVGSIDQGRVPLTGYASYTSKFNYVLRIRLELLLSRVSFKG